MKIILFTFKIIRKLFHVVQNVINPKVKQTEQYQKYVSLFNQQANDYIREKLRSGEPCMISKFGTIELNNLVSLTLINKKCDSMKECFIKLYYRLLQNDYLDALCKNAGFFPNDTNLLPHFYDIYHKSIKNIDILGSYIKEEIIFRDELQNAIKVNLDGYYAPFLFSNPWTIALTGKKVLLIHPFVEEAKIQYKKRSILWNDKDVLPEFTLITYKSVQSMLNIETPHKTWFEALNKMQTDISKIDFDIALVGCGAYGMPIASYIKDMGKQAIHLAGWTQVLFGIIGKRWEDNPQVAPFINENWIRPDKNNIPNNASKIENGCYW